MSIPEEKWKIFPKVKVVTTERKNLFLSVKDFKKQLKNDDELKNVYGGTISILFLCSANFSFPFDLLSKIFSKSNILDIASIIPKSNTISTSQPMWFEFSKQLKNVQFEIPVCLYEGDFLLNYTFIYQSEFTTKMALQLFTKTLDIEFNNAFFVNSRSEIFEADYKNFLKAIIENKVFIVVQLTTQKIRKIKERINVVHEILQSEITYNLRLRKVKEEIVKFFGENSLLDKENQILFESLIESLYKMSNDIMNEMLLYKSYYMAPIGKIFLKFTKLIPIYHRYADILSEAMKNFRKNMEDPIFKLIAEKFQSEPYFESLSIDQYMHEPEQRLPRYRLFIQRVFEITPWGHPDKVLLISVLEKFDNERIKSNDQSLFNKETLSKYPSDLKQYADYLPLEEGQGYICNYKVFFDNQESIAVLYSDYIRIFNIKSKSAKVIDYPLMRILSDQDQEKNDKSNELVIFVFNCNCNIKFETKNDLNSFISNMKEASYMTQLKRTNIMVALFWNNKISKCPIHLQNHSMSELNGNIYVFGGVNEKGQISSSFISYKISEDSWKIYESNEKKFVSFPQARKDAVMITVNKKIFLFAGYSENMNPFNDLWTFDGNEWILIDGNITIAQGGYYSAIEFLNDQILFVGGNKTTQTLIYSIKKNEWKEICQKVSIPLIKYHNVVYNENSKIILLFGGMLVSENEPMKDLFVFDLEKNSWIKNSTSLAGQFPSPRYGNLTACLKTYIFILGGIGSNTPFVLSRNLFHMIRNEGKFPVFMSFAASCVVDDAIWALGGATEDGTSDAFYKITILRE